jgi:hypothetical protein
VRKAEVVEAPVVEVPEVAANCHNSDMSVQEHLIEEEVAQYARMIEAYSMKDLRMSISHAGLAVRSRSKDVLIQALVAHRRATLQAACQPSEEIAPVEECPQDAPVEAELPELPDVEEEPFDNTPLTLEEAALFEQIGNEQIVLADEWAIPDMLPTFTLEQTAARVTTASQAIEARLLACGFMR